MGDRRQKYEDKGARPRKLFGVRLSEQEEASAKRIARDGETVQDVLRRLLNEKAKRSR